MAGDAGDGRRVRGEQARVRGVAAALGLFARQGYSATSVAMIADAAGVHSQSLYHAFGSKEGLLAAAMEQAAHDFFEELQAVIDAPSPEQALALLADVFGSSPQYLRLHLVLILERGDGDAGLMERAGELRRQGRLMVEQVLAPAMWHVPAARRTLALDDLSRLLMVFLDGAFIERQVNSDDGQFDRLFALIGPAMQGALMAILEGQDPAP